MSEAVARDTLAFLGNGTAISAVEIHASRDGRRREVLIVAPAGGVVRDLTRPVALLIGSSRGRHGGLVVERYGYDALHEIAAALGAVLGNPITYHPFE